MNDSKELLQKWIDAFNSNNIESVMNCYAEDAVNFQVAAGTCRRTRADSQRHGRIFQRLSRFVGED